MSCEYCKDGKVIFKEKALSLSALEFAAWQIKNEEEADALSFEKVVYIDDRGYLRYVEDGEQDCLDHGDKVRANYCFNCGDLLNI